MAMFFNRSGRFIVGLSFFFKEKGMTVAAASSFYAVLTIIPLYLLIIRMLGAFAPGLAHIKQDVFNMAKEVMPNLRPETLYKVENIFFAPLTAGAPLTIFNLFIFSWSLFTFLNSIWNGLYLMTGDRSFTSSWRHAKGIVIIIITAILISITLLLPSAFLVTFNIFKDSSVLKLIANSSPDVYEYVMMFSNAGFNLGSFFLSNIFYLLVLVLYFSFFYSWLFSKRVTKNESMVASVAFVSFLLIGKNMFWIYLMYIRQGLVTSYGDYYIFFIALVWIFTVMSFFYYGASICYASILKKKCS
jgi:membrane protein